MKSDANTNLSTAMAQRFRMDAVQHRMSLVSQNMQRCMPKTHFSAKKEEHCKLVAVAIRSPRFRIKSLILGSDFRHAFDRRRVKMRNNDSARLVDNTGGFWTRKVLADFESESTVRILSARCRVCIADEPIA